MKQLVLIIASIVVSGVLLYLALRDVDLAAVWTTIQQVDGFWLLISFVMVFFAIATRAVRWRGLLNHTPSLRASFHVFNVGTLLNQLPLRVGEVARAVLISREGVPVVTAVTSVLIERLIDLVVVALLIAFGLSRLPESIPTAASAAQLLGFGAVAGFVVLIALARFPHLANRILAVIEQRIPFLARLHLRQRLDELLIALRPLTHLRSAAHAIGWTIINWAFSLATFAALLRAFNIESVDYLTASALGIGLVAFGIAVPVTVAGIGPTQGAVRLAGEALALNAVTSAALGVVFHAVTVLSYAAWGIVGLIALGVALGDLIRRPQGRTKSEIMVNFADISTGARIEYERVYLGTNEKPEVLIAIHGWMGTGRAHFGDLLEWLGATYQVYAPTRRGYGLSEPKPRDYPSDFYTRDAYDMLAFMDAMGIEKAHILGWSDGGETALVMGGIAPERCLSVAVWGAVGAFDESIRERILSNYPPTWLDSETKRLNGLDDASADRLVKRWVTAMIDYLDRGGDVSKKNAHKITAPLLLMLGDKDTLNPQHLGQQFVDACRRGQLKMFETGHAIHWEKPDEFKRALSQFYASIRQNNG